MTLDCRNVSGSIDHVRLFALLDDLSYHKDKVELIGTIYTNFITSFHGNHFGATPPIQITRGTILQGKTFNPHLFIIFLDPFLR
jgi:hypothetical protein